ncbi:multidrug resistance protein [Pseudohongiella nitratireducens]|uniref:Multidrug resistance protein n=1 Tax=Pseudohongiella nitratireducens TaxID=1768907 RepID=A0A917GRT4_9GAMM|nr:efflux RND transporter permease subunit [Pseudohongiella nitratireducens]GGG54746.1 multidrug resistance protein [Pseudohongiella nitratireducens]
MTYLKAAVSRARTTLSIFVVIILVGFASYRAIPVELNPDVTVPVIITTIIHPGISPEDAERLLVRPTEIELKDVEGITQTRAFANEGAATVITEFDVEMDPDIAMQDIRTAVDRAQARYPANTEEPIMQEVSAATMPVVQIAIGGEGVSERVRLQIAQELQREIENLTEILSADMIGAREELLEIIVDPAKLETYGVSNQQVIQAVTNNNRLIPAGTLNTGSGSFSVKVPGLIETADDLYELPIAATAQGTLVLSDLAEVRRTFKDAERYAYANEQAAISLNVQKRKGANLIDAMDQIDVIVQELRQRIPPAVTISYLNNTIPLVIEQNSGLQGNMATAMALVMVVVVAAVGMRSGILVAMAVPFSFFFAFIIISLLGFTYNFMVIFGLLLGLGMLIDGAIVMVEFADRKMAEGFSRVDAFQESVSRMFWPILASTGTTLAAFLPMLFWPGVSGEFMGYLPATVFAVLVGSLLYALLFAPTIGSMLGKPTSRIQSKSAASDSSDERPEEARGIVGIYARVLKAAVHSPALVTLGSVLSLVVIVAAYGTFGRGVEFFTAVEPAQTQVQIFTRGNYSPEEIRDIMLDVQDRIAEVGYYKSIVTQSGAGRSIGGGQGAAPDLVGTIFLEFTDRRTRDLNGFEVEDAYREAISDIPGVRAEIATPEQGPPVGKELQLELYGENLDGLISTAREIRDHIENEMTGLIDIDDTTPVPGIEWEITVDRARAAMSGANMNEIGTAVQLLTTGVFMGDYRPDDSEEEVEIRARYPREYRGIEQIDNIRINTQGGGLVPISSFIQREPRPSVSSIQRVDGSRVVYVRANPAPGEVTSNKVAELQQWLDQNPMPPGVEYRFRGANEEQEESFAFLLVAFGLSMSLMAILLVTQFNSYYQTILILSSVLLSTAGVLLGLLLTNQTFSVILTGVGIVSLAGIIVNNNIVLIDTFNYLRNRHRDWDIRDVIIQTGVQRLRPVFLTTFTTGCGLLPLAMHVSVDLIGAEVEVGGPITSQWVQLANAIVFGLTFATILTLIVTPAMLALPEQMRRHRDRIRRMLPGRKTPQPSM